MSNSRTLDVVIAGGGPNGLMLACELALAGIRPLVLERLIGPSDEQRANGLVGQVVRMLDRRGLYERLSGNADVPQPAPRYMFAAFPLDLGVLPDNPLYLLTVPQRRIEQVLAERAAELGVEVRRGHELTSLYQDSDSVTVGICGQDGDYSLRTRYLVGADGGHSITRKLAGIGFPGVTVDNTVLRSAAVSVPAGLIDASTGGLNIPRYGIIAPFMHHRTEHGMITYAPFPNRAPIISTSEHQPSAHDDPGTPVTLAELHESVKRVLGTAVAFGEPEGPGPHLLRRQVGGNTRLADRYRAGRILLLGDAAHVHSAIGGSGLNLGLQDAINLGWKLAAHIHGWAPQGLLDTYETERRPAAQRVTMHTQAQAVLTAPGSQITALRTIFGEMLTDSHNIARIADLISGADIRYSSTPQDHELCGRWAPDLLLHNGSRQIRLAELTRDGRPLLLDLTTDHSFAQLAAPWQQRVGIITAQCGQSGPTALLLRPDCYIAWASASPQAQDHEQTRLSAALSQWFGTAATVPV